MTDFASLVLAVDSTQVPKGTAALDNLAKSGDNATRAANQLAAAEKAKALEAERAAAGLVKASSAAGMARMASLDLAKSGATVTASVGQQRAGMQQLSYQLSDVATMFALGAKPMQIFASQSGQVIQAVSMMAGSTGKLGAFLGGPWGIAVVAATTVLAPFIAQLFNTASAADTARNALQSLIEKRRQALAEEGAVAASSAALKKQVDERDKLEKTINERRALNARMGNSPDAFIYAEVKRYRELNAAIAEGGAAIAREAASRAESAQRTAQSTARVTAHTAATRAAGGATRAHTAAISDAQKALEAQTKATDQYIESLQREIAAIGKTPKELRAMEVARQKEAAATAKQAAEIDKLAAKRENALARQANADWERSVLEPLRREYELLGLTGAEREKAALAMEEEAFKTELLAKGVDHVNGKWLEYYQTKLDIINKESALQKDIEAAAILQEQVDALIGAFGSLRGVIGGGLGNLVGALTSGNPTAGLLGMGGLGTAAGLLLGGGGAYDKLLGLSQTGLGKLGIGGALGSTLSKGLVGAGLGSMFGSITGSGTGGGIGGAAASLIGLGPIGVIGGGLIGGLIGKLFGGLFSDPDQAVASLALSNGKAGFGNLFKEGKNKDEYASQVSDAAGAVADAINSIVSSLGGSVTASLGNISIGQYKGKWAVNDGSKAGFRGLAAGDPGATVYGSAEEAIKAAIQLAIKSATSGLSDQVKNLLTMPGADLEQQLGKAQAFQAIVKEAAEATHPLGEALKALQAQFDELNAVFAEASATTEQLAQLSKFEAEQRKALVGAFTQFIDENFTTEADKLAKATAEASAEMQRLGFAGVSTKAQFKALADSVDTTTDAGVTLLEALVKIAPQFLTVADAAEQAAAAEAQRQEAITAQRQDLQIQLLEAMGDKTLALAMQRQRELAAMDESLRPLQELIWATQDHAAAVADARNVLADAYRRERAELTQTADRMRALADSLRSFRNSIYDSADAVSRNASLSRLMIIGAQAAAGNESAARDLPNVTNRFLDASRNSASTLTQFRRDQALAANYVDKAIAGIDAQASAAERQIAALDKQVEGLLELNTNVVTVDQAVKNLTALMEPPAAVMGNARLLETQEEQVDLIDRLIAEVERLNRDTTTLQFNMNERLARIDRFITRGETDGFKVTNDSDAPVYTSAV